MISKKNPRNIILKDISRTNNLSKYNFLNKRYTRNNISSIELSPRNEYFNIEFIEKYKNSIESKNSLNNNINFLNNKNALNKTQEKEEKNYYKYIKDNYSAEQNRIRNKPENVKQLNKEAKRINLSNVYKLPLILNKEFNTLKLYSSKNQIKLDTKREEIVKQNLNKISSIDNNDKKINKNLLNKNVNINIIDYNKIYVKKKLKPIKIFNKISDSGSCQKVNNYKKTKLQNYMKDRFYTDTEIRMNKKLKDIVFNHDHSLKDKIIEMNKIGDFWGGVVDYCNPVFSVERFHCLKKKLNKNKIKKEDEWIGKLQNSNSSRSKKNIKSEIKTMRLFTINSYADYKHKKQLELKKDFIEKNNDSLQYYMC